MATGASGPWTATNTVWLRRSVASAARMCREFRDDPFLIGGVRHHPEPVRPPPPDDEVVDDPAILIEDHRVLAAPRLDAIDVVAEQGANGVP